MDRRRLLIVVIVVTVLLLFLALAKTAGIKPAVKNEESLSNIKLPEGFKISLFATGLGGSSISRPGTNPGPRMMLLNGDTLFVTLPAQGKVIALKDDNGDWRADEAFTFIEGLAKPHGIDFYNGWFYIAGESTVIRVRDEDGNLAADKDSTEVLIGDLPTGGHSTRTVKVHNGSMYVSIGSSCNVCNEEDERRAAIIRCSLTGKNCTVFAEGMRNAVGFIFSGDAIYATENGRDLLGGDAPPDEINMVEESGNYGWPTCYGKNIHDTDFDKNTYIRNPCMEPFEAESLVDLQAHSAPLGLARYESSTFPEPYRGDIFVAFHGSWNRAQPTGYKIVNVDIATGKVSDFATGWLQQSGNVLGRPVDIIVAADGSLLVSDDNAGSIYRISYSS